MELKTYSEIFYISYIDYYFEIDNLPFGILFLNRLEIFVIILIITLKL